ARTLKVFGDREINLLPLIVLFVVRALVLDSNLTLSAYSSFYVFEPQLLDLTPSPFPTREGGSIKASLIAGERNGSEVGLWSIYLKIAVK
ncbi:MAG: hypothetical protein NWQ28_08660, partial [Nodularia sp. (in: cyanobacteria)]|nr:hypothetical protein [Nodularia sp. (in: cyanobacteria)]